MIDTQVREGIEQGGLPPCSTRGIYKGRLPLFVPGLFLAKRLHLPKPRVTHLREAR